MPREQVNLLGRAHGFLVYFGGLYACFLVLLTIPTFQRHFIFLHKIKWPLWADFALPEKYGLAPQKVTNVNITTSDNSSYSSLATLDPSSSTFSSDSASISSALRLYPTIIYFHGNAGTRAVSFRIATYMSYTTRLGTNVLAVDYRGYGDSEGMPNEQGLRQDAHATWQWAVSHGADPEDIVLVGQSLGTGVAAQLAQDLAVEDVKPRGLVLIAPFSSLATLLKTYNLGGWIPLLKPLQSIPLAQALVLRFLKTRFDTKAALVNVKTDVVLLHAEDDFDIPLSHSIELFDTLLEPLLPPPALTQEDLMQPGSISGERWAEFKAVEDMRQRVKEEIVHTGEVEGFGRISRFKRSGHGAQVVLLESKWGGHDHVGRLEGVIDVVGDVLKLKRIC